MRPRAILPLLAILALGAACGAGGAEAAVSARAHDRVIERQARKAFAVFRHRERRTDVPRLAGDDAVLNPILRKASTRRIARGNGFDGYLVLNAGGLGAVCLLLVTPGDTPINHVCGDSVPGLLATHPSRTAKLPDGRVAIVMPMADGAPPAILLTSDLRLYGTLQIRGNALAEVVPEHQVVALLPPDGSTSIILVEAVVPAAPAATWTFLPPLP